MLCQDLGERERGEVFVTESVALFRSLGETLLIASPLNNLGLLVRDGGDLVRAKALLEESLALFRVQKDRQSTAVLLNNLGKVVLWLGDTVRARSLLQESLALFEELREARGMALTRVNLAQVAHHERNYGEALALFKAGLKRYHEVGDKRGQAECLEGIAEVSVSAALETNGTPKESDVDWQGIAMLLRAAAELRAASGASLSEVDRRHLDRAILATQAQLGDEVWDHLWANGQGLSQEEVLVRAMRAELPAFERGLLHLQVATELS